MDACIAILGGTFDPIHIGHLTIAEDVRFALGAAQVVFVPTAQQPLKAQRHAASASDRLAMVRLAIADNPAFRVSDVEVERGGLSYTVDTVSYFRSQYPNNELFIVVGADALAELPRWYKVQRLLELCRLAVVKRPGHYVDLAGLYAALPSARDRITLITGPELTISASEVRRRLRAGEPVRYHLPAGVWQYIVEQGLYDAEHR
jgi:nicotinate-nucleotide adenylyltransferase